MAGLGGQFCVTTMRGVVTSGQVADAVEETLASVQASRPLAVTVLLTEQASAGAVTNGQVADFVSVTTVAVQASLPLAVTVLLTEHASAGAVKLAAKFCDAPGARLGTVNTVPAWLLTTVTLFKLTLPEFLTVPV